MLEEIKYAGENTIRAVIEETKNEFNKRLYVPASSESDDGKILSVVNGSAAWVDGAVESDYYYTSLSSAIADINNGVTTNSMSDANSAKVRVFYSETGRLTVQLLDNITENVKIDITKSIDLLLNGKTLTFDSISAYLNYTVDVYDCVIDGTIIGSEIVKNAASETTTAASHLISFRGKYLHVTGGIYSNTSYSAGCAMVIATFATCDICEVRDCTLNSKVLATGMARGIQVNGKKFIISGVDITSSSFDKQSLGLWNSAGELICENSNLSINSDSGIACGIYFNDTVDGLVVTCKNTTILADAVNCHTTDLNHAIGIYSTFASKLFIEDSNIFGTHSAVSSSGSLYINGGLYTGYCHGGAYINGNLNDVYINNATLCCGNYKGIYDYSNKQSSIYGCMYVGGQSDITVNLDGCTFGDGSTGGNAIVLRGTDGEQYNTVNISNSTITNGTGGIRIDNETHKLNVGVGCNITADKIGHPEWAEFTNALYRMNHADKILTGDDYNAITSFYGITGTNNEVSWDELEDKPFGEMPTGSDTLRWDGNREGLVRADDYEQYLISESIPTLDDFVNGASNTKLDGDTETSTNLELHAAIYEAGDGAIVVGNSIIALKDGASVGDIIYPKKGTYFTWIGNDCYTTSLTIPGYNGFPSSKLLDEKWLPKHTHQIGPTPITTEGDGAAYTATVDGITALTAGISFTMIPHTTSTSKTATLNVNGLGAKMLRRPLSSNNTTTVANATDNWLYASSPVEVMYNGTYWVVTSMPRPNGPDIYGTVPVANGGVPSAGSANEGKFLRVVNGTPEWEAVDVASNNDPTKLTLIDEVTGSKYELTVVNGKLTMAEVTN